jgi:hypothetical protein
MSALSAEEQMSELIEKSTKEKRNKVITGIYEHMHKNYRKREIPHITQQSVSKVFTVLENYCKILHTGKVTKPIPAGIFHSSNLAIKNCSAFKMQQRITEFFENNKMIDVDRMTSMDILKNLITEAEYETALEKFSPDKSSSSSPRTPRTPRSHHSSKENDKNMNMEDVDGGAKKQRKTRKSRKSRKNKKTSKRRSKK